MSSKIYTQEQIKEILYPVFKQYGVHKAFLFGSYVKGAAKADSDVDIVVDSGLRGLSFYGLLEEVVISLDKKVDLLDVTQIVPESEIDREIKKTGVLIYG
ncbi:MAG: nucleotidyltransferase domain-containing protein [Acetatifactor sp.]|nr:nucleotidyltransferase domain-containing protein [Acetatifactor sp.]